MKGVRVIFIFILNKDDLSIVIFSLIFMFNKEHHFYQWWMHAGRCTSSETCRTLKDQFPGRTGDICANQNMFASFLSNQWRQMHFANGKKYFQYYLKLKLLIRYSLKFKLLIRNTFVAVVYLVNKNSGSHNHLCASRRLRKMGHRMMPPGQTWFEIL